MLLLLSAVVLIALVYWFFYRVESDLVAKTRQMIHLNNRISALSQLKGKKRMLAIVNPISGSRKAMESAKLLGLLCEDYGIELSLQTTQHKNHCCEIASVPEYLKQFDLIVIIGGDGMLMDFINGVEAPSTTNNETTQEIIPYNLALIPSGTGNGVATSLGIRKISDAMEAIFNAKQKAIDLLEIGMLVSSNEAVKKVRTTKKAALSVSWGFIADIDTISENAWRWMGKIRTILVPLFMMLGNRRYRGKVEYISTDSEEAEEKWQSIEGDFALVTVMNLPWLTNDCQFAPNCDMSNGTMQVVLVHSTSRFEQFKLFLQVDSGNHVNHPDVQILNCRKVRIIPAPSFIDCNYGNIVADGEILGKSPVEVHCIKQAIKFQIP